MNRVTQVRQFGFSLIELVMVVVVIGVLATVAAPKFQDMVAATQRTATQATASELGVAAVVAYAKFMTDGTPMPTQCSDFGETPYIEGTLSYNYSISGSLPDCVVTGPLGTSGTFYVPH